MTEWMLFVRRSRRDLRTQQADDRRCSIRQIIHSIGRDGDRVREGPYYELHDRQEDITEDSRHTSESTVGAAVVRVLYELFYQNISRDLFPLIII